MNNSNPLVPQGSLLEQQNKGRNRFKVAVFCVFALHIVFVGGLLMVGCKKDQHDNASGDVTQLPPSNIDTNVPVIPENNPPAPANNLAATPNTGTPVPPAPLPGPTAAPLPGPAPTPVPPVPEPTAVGAPSDYVVAKGDSFYTIAKKFGVSMKAIQNANPSVSPTKLKVGQKIQIPPASAASISATGSNGTPTSTDTSGGSTYTVKSGDTLVRIAKNQGVSVKALRSANNLKTDRIKVGEKLKIPSKASAPAAPSPEALPVPTAPATTGAVPPLSAPPTQ